MVRFVTADHHFGHSNIIDYCDRGFIDIEDMEDFYRTLWNTVVSDEDSVYHLGDFGYRISLEEIKRIASTLNGTKMLFEGNHDNYSRENYPFPVVQSSVIQHGKYRFWVTHNPENVPDDWTEWVLTAHSHNNKPFIDYSNHMINVGVDVTRGYPVPIENICKALNQMHNGDVSKTIADSDIQHHQWYQDIL